VRRRSNGKSHTKIGNNPQNNLSSPFKYADAHLTHQYLGGHHSPPQTAAQLLHPLSYSYAAKSPLVTMGHTTFTPKIVPSFGRSPPLCNTPILRPSPLTTPNGIQIGSAVFAGCTPRSHTHTHTHRPTDGTDVFSNSCLHSIESAATNNSWCHCYYPERKMHIKSEIIDKSLG